MKESDSVLLDVREDLARGRKPLWKIVKAFGALRATQRLELLAPFEPVPLLAVARKFGFKYDGERLQNGEWRCWFGRNLPERQTARTEEPMEERPEQDLQVDARGLEPPQPLIRIVTALGDLRGSAKLTARTDRRPMHLLDSLPERGFEFSTREDPGAGWVTTIWRRAATTGENQ